MASKLCAFTRFNKPPYQISPSGSKMREEYTEFINDEGKPDLKITGEYDFQAQIDAFKDDCDIYRILDRLGVSTKSPDVVQQALSQFKPDMFVPGSYGDFTDMPKNIHEVAKFYRDSVEFFNCLPADVRAEYGYSVDRFFADFDNFAKKYTAKASEEVTKPAESEVKSDE